MIAGRILQGLLAAAHVGGGDVGPIHVVEGT